MTQQGLCDNVARRKDAQVRHKQRHGARAEKMVVAGGLGQAVTDYAASDGGFVSSVGKNGCA